MRVETNIQNGKTPTEKTNYFKGCEPFPYSIIGCAEEKKFYEVQRRILSSLTDFIYKW